MCRRLGQGRSDAYAGDGSAGCELSGSCLRTRCGKTLFRRFFRRGDRRFFRNLSAGAGCAGCGCVWVAGSSGSGRTLAYERFCGSFRAVPVGKLRKARKNHPLSGWFERFLQQPESLFSGAPAVLYCAFRTVMPRQEYPDKATPCAFRYGHPEAAHSPPRTAPTADTACHGTVARRRRLSRSESGRR